MLAITTLGGASRSQIVSLPEPPLDGPASLERTLATRHSIREYDERSLTLDDVSALLWACQGEEGRKGGRTAPSAGALYPLELFLLAGRVDGLEAGLYRYRPGRHDLVSVASGDRRVALAAAALGQDCVREAPAVLVIAGVYERTTGKYGRRGVRYVHMEVGHAAQNVYLQATARALGTVFVGAFDDDRVGEVLELSENVRPLGLMPVGHPR